MCGRRDESLLLDDLVDAAARLIELRSGIPRGALGTDRDTNERVLFNLIVLGEAAKRLDPKVRARWADMPWADMAETRDRIVHHYEGIDWLTVADIIERDLPPLLMRLTEIRDELRAEFDASEPG